MKRLVTLLVGLCLPISATYAVKLQNLYEVSISMASQTEDLKEQAIENGFLQLLIRLSGDPNINQNRVIKENLPRADYYVQDVSYSPVTTSSSEYLLQIRYEPTDVARLLKKARVMVWNINRPVTLLWLAVTDKNNDTKIISSDSGGDLYSLLKESSDKLGLPLILPMMDMDDMNGVSANDVRAMVMPVLKSAAERYAPDAILVGSMDENPQGWDSQWELIVDKTRWQWRVVDKTSDAVVKAALNQATVTMAKNLAGAPGNAQAN